MEIDLAIEPEKTTRTLTDFLKSGIARSGLPHAVVSVSGGIDSAVACVLAVEALGAENVLALCLPYRSSSPESLTDARALIGQLGCPSLTIEITAMVDALLERFPDMDPLRRGNVMARARMIVGYDQSQAFRGLVIGTGNKTEILLGYTTLYGDSACALNPVGDLYKTQLRQLARSLPIPAAILEKAPSADLWQGQTDEGELGFTYEKVDRLLFLLFERRLSPEECVQAGFPEPFVRQVIERIRRNRFKRMLPPIASLSGSTPGPDLAEPREWGG